VKREYISVVFWHLVLGRIGQFTHKDGKYAEDHCLRNVHAHFKCGEMCLKGGIHAFYGSSTVILGGTMAACVGTIGTPRKRRFAVLSGPQPPL
jgi:hypothetical protein